MEPINYALPGFEYKKKERRYTANFKLPVGFKDKNTKRKYRKAKFPIG
jgi:hypothetical protein